MLLNLAQFFLQLSSKKVGGVTILGWSRARNPSGRFAEGRRSTLPSFTDHFAQTRRTRDAAVWVNGRFINFIAFEPTFAFPYGKSLAREHPFGFVLSRTELILRDIERSRDPSGDQQIGRRSVTQRISNVHPQRQLVFENCSSHSKCRTPLPFLVFDCQLYPRKSDSIRPRTRRCG